MELRIKCMRIHTYSHENDALALIKYGMVAYWMTLIKRSVITMI